MMVASALCAFSPTISVMMVARLVQGFSGGWAMVIARSLVVDLASGPRLVKALNLVQGIAGIAPIVGPAARCPDPAARRTGGCRSGCSPPGARSMLVTVAVTVPESLPADRRHGGGLRQLRGAAGQVLQVAGLRRLPGRDGVLDGRHLRLRRHLGVRAAVHERALAGDLLDRLRRQRRRADAGHPGRGPPRGPGADPRGDRHRARRDRRRRACCCSSVRCGSTCRCGSRWSGSSS